MYVNQARPDGAHPNILASLPPSHTPRTRRPPPAARASPRRVRGRPAAPAAVHAPQ